VRYPASSDSAATDSPMPAMSSPDPCFLAAWYRRELSDTAIDDFFALLKATIEDVSTEAAPVRLVATLFVPTDDALYGVFTASAPEVVAAACARAGMHPERLIPNVSLRSPERRNGGTLRDASRERDQDKLFRVSNSRYRC
jgi:hypothetical protein